MSTVKEAPGQKERMTETVPTESLKREAGRPVRGTHTPMAWGGHPIAWMRHFAEEMDRMLEGFGMERGLRIPSMLTRGRELLRRETGMIPARWSPQIDVLEREGKFLVRVDLPGMTREQVKVEATNEFLTISGERRFEIKKEEKEGLFYNERSFGSFYRAIPLPEGVDVAKATAEFKNGVLEVVVPVPKVTEQPVKVLEVREVK